MSSKSATMSAVIAIRKHGRGSSAAVTVRMCFIPGIGRSGVVSMVWPTSTISGITPGYAPGARYFRFRSTLRLYQLWGTGTPAQARRRLERERIPIASPANLEEFALATVGPELYELFIRGYTAKQWKRAPRDLPPEIIKRIPFRNDFNDNYFGDPWQGLPSAGYTDGLFKSLLKNIPVKLATDYLADRAWWDARARTVLYTGKVDEYFGYCRGQLEYVGLDFRHTTMQQPDFQGCPVMNYADEEVPYTRIIEHKHFRPEGCTVPPAHEPTQRRRGRAADGNEVTVISYEEPNRARKNDLPCYPVPTAENKARYAQYKKMRNGNCLFGGRLGDYRYYNMDETIAAALKLAEKEKVKVATEVSTIKFRR